MATVTTASYTPEDLLKIRDRPMPELIDGQLLEREVSQKSDAIAAMMLGYLWVFVREHDLGLLNGAQGTYQIFPGKPNRVRIPDVSFTRKDRIPASGPSDGHARIAPDLVVEVTSPNDAVAMIETKVSDFLSAGVPLIWIIVPESRIVHVYRPGRIALRLGLGDILDGEDVLPGFRCEVAALFA